MRRLTGLRCFKLIIKKCPLIHLLVLDQLGAEEVVLVDEEESGKLLQFTTDPGDLAVVQQGMVGIGYMIEEVYMGRDLFRRTVPIETTSFKLYFLQAKVVYIPTTTTQLSPIEANVLNKLVNLLEELTIVMGVHHNVE